MDLLSVIIKPIISEKSMSDAAKSKFTFMVNMSANKRNIKKAVEDKFKVNVLKVFTNIVKGRTTKVGVRRKEIVKSSFKKAMVQLEKGQKIAMFDIGGSS